MSYVFFVVVLARLITDGQMPLQALQAHSRSVDTALSEMECNAKKKVAVDGLRQHLQQMKVSASVGSERPPTLVLPTSTLYWPSNVVTARAVLLS